MVELQLPKLIVRVRFPSSAPFGLRTELKVKMMDFKLRNFTERYGHHQLDFPIQNHQLSYSHRIALDRLLDLSQDNDALASNLYGLPDQDLQKHGLVWIIFGMKGFLFTDLPQAGDRCLLDSWQRQQRGVRFQRDNLWLKQKSDSMEFDIFACLTTDWVLLHLASRKLVRPLDYFSSETLQGGWDNFACFSRKISKLQFPHTYEYEVVYPFKLSDVDQNLHIHNTVYIRDAINCLAASADFGLGHSLELKAFEANFIKESLPGENLRYRLAKVDQSAPFIGNWQSDVFPPTAEDGEFELALVEVSDSNSAERKAIVSLLYTTR